jgi:hypothetical protein
MQNTTEIRTWAVSWSIDLEAASAEQAAAIAARDYLQAGHTATVFDIKPRSGVWGEPVEVDTASDTDDDRAAAWDKLHTDLDEASLTSDYERADVLAHIAHNLAALLPPAALKAAIDCAVGASLICLEPSSGQDKADELRRMMEGQI